MGVSYTETFTDGAVSLSGGSTWAAAAKVILSDQSQAINTGLDVSTNAIDLMHVIGRAPRIVSSSGGTATVKIDNTYTTDPNIVWRAGGYSKLTFSTNACPLAIYLGGTHVIAGGTVSLLVVGGTADVTVESGATITAAVVSGGKLTTHSAIATVTQAAGLVEADVRMGSTSYTLSGGRARIENRSGSACTILNLEAAGIFEPLAGNVATLNRRGGTINYDTPTTSLTLGSTAFTNYAGAIPSSTGLITISNLTDYSAYAYGGGGTVILP